TRPTSPVTRPTMPLTRPTTPVNRPTTPTTRPTTPTADSATPLPMMRSAIPRPSAVASPPFRIAQVVPVNSWGDSTDQHQHLVDSSAGVDDRKGHPTSRRGKIVCTLGPATSSEESIADLVAAGMDVAR